MKGGKVGKGMADRPWQRRAWLVQSLLMATPGAFATVPVVPMALSDGLNQPFAEALLRELAEAAGWRWQVSRVPFSRVLRMTEAGEALGFGVSPSREREAQLVFSEPVFRSGVWAIGRAAGDGPITSVAGLKGRTVCAPRQARLGAELDMAAGRDFQLHAVPGDLGSRLRMLEAGRCDVLLVTHFNDEAALLLRRVRDAGFDPDRLAIGPRALKELPVYIAARRGSALADLVPALNRAIADRQTAIGLLLLAGP